MTEKVAYLDSSAIVKRYVYETGSEFIRAQYNEAYFGNIMLSLSPTRASFFRRNYQ